MQINFKGTLVHYTSINKKENNIKTNTQSAFVKLDVHSKNDINTLSELNHNWKADLIKTIHNSAFCDSVLPQGNKNFYVMTLQKNQFNLLDPEKILGVVEFDKWKNSNEIAFLQVNPKYCYKQPKQSLFTKLFRKKRMLNSSQTPTYQHIGTEIINSLKAITDKSIELFSLQETKDFYKKNGFKNAFNSSYFIWKKK